MTEIMSTADLKSLLEKRRRDSIEQDEKMEREELLREIRELENHISRRLFSNSDLRSAVLMISVMTLLPFLFFLRFLASLAELISEMWFRVSKY